LKIKSVFGCHVLQGVEQGIAADAFAGLIIVSAEYVFRFPVGGDDI
jgi:hypothetical protein